MTGVKHDEYKPQARYFYYSGLAALMDEESSESLLVPYESLLQSFLKGRDRLNGLRYYHNCIVDSFHKEGKTTQEVILKVADVSKLGAEKYGIFNYQAGMDWSRLIDALGRHLIKFVTLDKFDDESGLDHRYHMLANIYMLAYYVKNDVGINDLEEERRHADK